MADRRFRWDERERRWSGAGREAVRALFGGRDHLSPRDPLVLVLIYLLAVSLLFVVFPSIDLWFSSLFYVGGAFEAVTVTRLVELRRLGDQLIILTIVVLAASLLGKLVWPERPIGIRPRATAFLLASLILGPGLIVNGLFKSYSGRPRPVAVDAFGGTHPFVPAWQFSDACHSNCSFISGEASTALWLMGAVMLAPRELRLWFGVPVGLMALALSLNRIAFGGHFASDVLISFGFTALVLLVTYRLLVASPFGRRIDLAVEASLADAGRSLKDRLAALLRRP